MYKSPIEILTDEVELFVNNEVYTACQRVGVNVDKEELLRALQYDRNQYDKGYADGKRDAMDELVRCKDCVYGKLDNAAYYHDVYGNENDTTLYHCLYGFGHNKGEHFCSYGERREGE